MSKIERIGLRVNKGDKVFVRVQDATVELGIGGGQIASALTTHEPSLSTHHSNMVLEIDEMKIKNNVDDWRIRKLTPKECWRLMGYTDKDYDNASQVNSGTQLYKQAGNAIVKQVLMAIFSQLNIKGVKAWNDMTETEKRDIIKKTTMAGE